MKLNFKKIASVLTSTVMLSSTVAFAAAANFPEPFVKDGAGSYAIVVGAGASDATAAQNINAYLTDMVTVDATDDTPITIDGDSFMLEKSNNKFNLGDSLNSTYQSLDEGELTTMLAEGVYEDESGDEYDYTQEIELNGTGITLAHIADSDINDDEAPVIGFDIANNVQLLKYTLDFTDTVVNTTAVMGETDLTFLGKTYYVSELSSSSSGLSMTLLDSANTATVFSNEPVTVTVNGETYEVEIVSVSESDTPSSSKATIKINGEQIASTNQGSSRKIADDVYLSILEVSEAARESDSHYVEFSIGNGQIVLTDGNEVEINDETVDGLTVDFDTSTGELNSMNLIWTTEDQVFLVPGDELVLPGFESVKLIVGDFVAAAKEDVKFKYSSDNYMYLEAPIKGSDGDGVKIPLLFFDGTSNVVNLGSSDDEVLVTSTDSDDSIALSVNEDDKSIFVATYISGDEGESYAFQVTGISEVDSGVKNETTVKDLATGKSTTVSVSDSAGEDIDLGNVVLTFTSVNGDAGTATVTITGTGSGIWADRLVTEEGLKISLPVINSNMSASDTPYLVKVPGVTINSTGDGVLGVTGSKGWMINLTEEDYDSDDVAGGSSFYANISVAGTDGPEISRLVGINTIPVSDSSDDEEGYMVTEMATKVLYRNGDDQRTLDVMYNGEEAYAQVYVAEGSATSSSGGSSGSLVVTDADVSDVSSKNLIVVGGTCVNKVAAKVLGVDAQYPVCGDAWETLTTVGAGEFLIQTVTSPYSSGKVAMLVAGYNQADTANAASALETETIAAENGKKYVQGAGSTLSLV